MAKHRGSVFTVVREVTAGHVDFPMYRLDGLIGTYLTLQRAEEVAGLSAQAFLDAGVNPEVYRFRVQISTYYDE